MPNPDAASLAHQLELVTQERDMLRQERERLQKDLDTEKERVAAFLRVLERLPLAFEPQGTPRLPVGPSVPRLASATRLNILELLRRHPSGLHRRQIEENIDHPTGKLGPTLNHMRRDGLLIHKGSGIYIIASPEAAPRA